MESGSVVLALRFNRYSNLLGGFGADAGKPVGDGRADTRVSMRDEFNQHRNGRLRVGSKPTQDLDVAMKVKVQVRIGSNLCDDQRVLNRGFLGVANVPNQVRSDIDQP